MENLSKQKNKMTNNRPTSLFLGNSLVLTKDLQKETHKILVINQKQQSTKIRSNKSYKFNRQIFLSQTEGKQIIKEGQLKAELSLYSSELINQKNELGMIRMSSNHFMPSQFGKDKKNLLQKMKHQLNSTIVQRINQILKKMQRQSQSQQQNQQKLIKIAEKCCINLEKQIFIQSIVMLIEKLPNGQQEENQIEKTRVIAIFQQCFPAKQFNKLELITMIGIDNYNLKVIASLKIYHQSIKRPDFKNPYFQVCHDCMKVIQKLSFAQQDLYCRNILENWQKCNINSKYTFTPDSYMKKIIQRDHFNAENEPFTHPYIQYFLNNQNKMACRRRWCGSCKLIYKRKMNLQKCDFCGMACKCLRCKKFEKLIKLLGHFIHIGGKYKEIQQKFIFTRVFLNKIVENPEINNESTYNNDWLVYGDCLKKMYDRLVNREKINYLPEWMDLPTSQIIANFQIQIQGKWEVIQERWTKDKMKEIDETNFHNTILKRLKLKKKLEDKRLKEFQAKLQSLSQQTKQKFQEPELQQRKILKNQFVKAKVFSSINPLTIFQQESQKISPEQSSGSSLQESEEERFSYFNHEHQRFGDWSQNKQRRSELGVTNGHNKMKQEEQQHQSALNNNSYGGMWQ